MIKVDLNRVTDYLGGLGEYREEHKVNVIHYSDFLGNMLDIRAKEDNRKYPYTVKVAKGIDDLLAGDYTPAKIIEVSSPILWNGHEMWTGVTNKDGVAIDIGYLNGDKRFLSPVSLDLKTLPHAFLGGSTGSGKSVTMNAILFSMFFRYAPWELEAVMSDAKISEFSRYGTTHKIPHIRNIAATEDASYLVSILEEFVNDMKKLNAAFGKAGCTNITQFCKKTGLTIPARVLIMDEVQAMFAGAGKKASKISACMEDVVRLGRSTNFHLIGASQELSSDLNGFIGNIPIRLCLKCNLVQTSEQLLGNSEGALGDVGLGKLYMNTNASAKKKSDNQKYRVPYQDDTEFEQMGKFLEEVGNRYDMEYPRQFYNENDNFFIPDLAKICEKKKPNELPLGIPSFVSKSPDCFSLKISSRNIDNILVYCNNNTGLERFYRTFYESAKVDMKNGYAKHVYLIGDDVLTDNQNPEEGGFFTRKVRDNNSAIWKGFIEQIYHKKLLVQVDEAVFANPKYDEYTENNFDNLLPGGIMVKNEINLSRLFYMRAFLREATYTKMYGLGNYASGDEYAKYESIMIRSAFNVLKSYGSKFINSKFNKSDLSLTYYHVLGVSKINGVGRMVRTQDVLKNALADCCDANVVFVLYSMNLEDMSELRSGIRYFVMDGVEATASKVRCEDYPESPRPACAVLYDSSDLVTRTFKKVKLSEKEI